MMWVVFCVCFAVSMIEGALRGRACAARSPGGYGGDLSTADLLALISER